MPRLRKRVRLPENRIGNRYGRLLILGTDLDVFDVRLYRCKCSCGNIVLKESDELHASASCGKDCATSPWKLNRAPKSRSFVLPTLGQIYKGWRVFSSSLERVDRGYNCYDSFSECICIVCGAEQRQRSYSLTAEKSTPAMCNSCHIRKKPSAKDIAGQRFGFLEVVRQSESRIQGCSKTFWICRCVCGNEKEIQGANLRAGLVESCGCAKGFLNSYRRICEKNGILDVYNRERLDEWNHLQAMKQALKNLKRVTLPHHPRGARLNLS